MTLHCMVIASFQESRDCNSRKRLDQFFPCFHRQVFSNVFLPQKLHVAQNLHLQSLKLFVQVVASLVRIGLRKRTNAMYRQLDLKALGSNVSDELRCLQMSSDVFRCLQMSSDVLRCLRCFQSTVLLRKCD